MWTKVEQRPGRLVDAKGDTLAKQPAVAAGSVIVEGLRASYGSVDVLTGVDLVIEGGEFVSMLGPSGCGKTTLLNTIAGFLPAKSGSIIIGGRNVTSLPPQKRGLSLVFQNYALFPHMTVAGNVGYGLRVARVPRAERARRVEEMLAIVDLRGYGDKYPRQLSGGQQQRVALARALVVEPAVLLLDEPLSNLDAKLRREMRVELRQLQTRVGTTTVLVTHDQEEALSVSSRIAVMRGGHVEQFADPVRIYKEPINRYVAEFIGGVNIIEPSRTRTYGKVLRLDWNGHCVEARLGDHDPCAAFVGILRPGSLRLSREAPVDTEANAIAGTVEYAVFGGDAWQYGLACEGTRLVAQARLSDSGLPWREGDHVWASWTEDDVLLVEDA